MGAVRFPLVFSRKWRGVERYFAMKNHAKAQLNQRLISNFNTYLLTWIDAFLVDQKAQGLGKRTVQLYTEKLQHFSTFCDGQLIKQVGQVLSGRMATLNHSMARCGMNC
jgi:hypothetical protein